MKMMDYLQIQLKYQFQDKSYLEMAMTHKSFCVQKNKDVKHNERLEFLGDAFLGLIIAELLMEKFPQDPEGALSKKRASLINQDVLSKKALAFKLQDLLILGPGEKVQGSHLKPRLLASAFEALLGAMYYDAGFELTKKFITTEFDKDITGIDPDVDFEKDYKTRLQELSQKLKLGTPNYELISSTGPSHKPEFLVAIRLNENEKMRASGASKKMAEQKAAQLLFAELHALDLAHEQSLISANPTKKPTANPNVKITAKPLLKQNFKNNTKKGNKS